MFEQSEVNFTLMTAKNQAGPSVAQDAKNYFCTFLGGCTSGVAGEIFTLAQANKLSLKAVQAPAFRDNVTISGVQQVAKDLSKAQLKKCTAFAKLARENPFLFGASTGLPMWFITRVFATPLQNSRKDNAKPFDGFGSSVVNDVTYHTIKNGIDEYCAANVFPYVLPRLDSCVTKKFVEGSIAGLVGGGCYVLAQPVKSKLTGQTLPEAFDLCVKSIPKVGLKKITYGLARPQIVKLLQ